MATLHRPRRVRKSRRAVRANLPGQVPVQPLDAPGCPHPGSPCDDCLALATAQALGLDDDLPRPAAPPFSHAALAAAGARSDAIRLDVADPHIAPAALGWPSSSDVDGYIWAISPDGEDLAPFATSDDAWWAAQHDDSEGTTERESERFDIRHATDSALDHLLDGIDGRAEDAAAQDRYERGCIPV